MKTTLEIPDAVFCRAKSLAVQRGIALRVLVTEALEEKLAKAQIAEKPWARLAGGLKPLRKETARINGILRGEFESVRPEDLK